MDTDAVTMMAGAFVPLIWMMGLSNYYIGGKRCRTRPLSFFASALLGMMTFIGGLTAVIGLMAICKYDINNPKNQSAMPIYVFALFLLCMDLWLDRPPSADASNPPTIPKTNVLKEAQTMVKMPGMAPRSSGDKMVYLLLVFVGVSSLVLMNQESVNGPTVEYFLRAIDIRTVAGIGLALPLLFVVGHRGQDVVN